jgi:hypothetical protein
LTAIVLEINSSTDPRPEFHGARRLNFVRSRTRAAGNILIPTEELSGALDPPKPESFFIAIFVKPRLPEPHLLGSLIRPRQLPGMRKNEELPR